MKKRTGETLHHGGSVVPFGSTRSIGDPEKRVRSESDGTVPRKGNAVYAADRLYGKNVSQNNAIMGDME